MITEFLSRAEKEERDIQTTEGEAQAKYPANILAFYGMWHANPFLQPILTAPIEALFKKLPSVQKVLCLQSQTSVQVHRLAQLLLKVLNERC